MGPENPDADNLVDYFLDNTLLAHLEGSTDYVRIKLNEIVNSLLDDNALAIARTPQTNKYDYAKKLKSQATHAKECKENKLDEFSFIGARVIHPNTPADEQ